MRILQLVQKPQRRGAEIFAFQLSQALRRQGHRVNTAYLYPYSGANPLPLQAGDVVLPGRESHPLEKVPGVHPLLLRQVMAHLDGLRPDVVQVNGARTIKYGAFARSFSRGRWPVVYRNIDNPAYWLRDPWRRFFYRRLVMPRIQGVVGVSEATLHNVKKLYGLAAPAVYIPNGVDPAPLAAAPTGAEARRQLGLAPGAALVLFIGSLARQKRPDRFLRVMQAVHRQMPLVEAWLVGDGPLRPALERQARQLGLERATRFWGYQARVGPYLAAADLLLITSDSDGIPAVVLEAGLLGKPTVATRVGGLPECIREGQTGHLLAAEDEAGLAQAVLDLLHRPRQRQAMGRRAGQWVEENFTIDVIARRYFDFYREVLGSP